MPETGDLEHRLRPARGTPDGALVLLHGRGTSEHDLYPLLDALDPGRRLAGITPRGPLVLPPGGAHWYVVRRVGYPDPPTFFATYARLTRFLDGFLEREGIAWGRTVIGGFSQGAVMSYATALGAGRPSPAAIVALSGFLPEVPGFELDLESRRGLPVAIAHGSHDPIIGVEFGRDARNRLESAGLEVTWRESPMPHAVDPRFLSEAAGVVEAALAPAA